MSLAIQVENEVRMNDSGQLHNRTLGARLFASQASTCACEKENLLRTHPESVSTLDLSSHECSNEFRFLTPGINESMSLHFGEHWFTEFIISTDCRAG